MMINYTILQSNDRFALTNKVKDFIDNGWEPHGNLIISNWVIGKTFYQAMIAKTNEQPREKEPPSIPFRHKSKN